jgi:hypothetical protein
MGRSLSLVLVGVLAAVGLTACSPEEPSAMPTFTDPPTTAVSTTASPEDQAAAEARRAFDRFRTVTWRLQSSGGEDVEELDSVASGSALRQYQLIQRQLIDRGLRTVGTPRLVSAKVTKSSTERVRLEACVDLTKTSAEDDKGEKFRTWWDGKAFRRSQVTMAPRGGLWRVESETVREVVSCRA